MAADGPTPCRSRDGVAVALLMIGLAGCQHRVPVETRVGPDQACRGRLVLEFTNRLEPALDVGWIPRDRLEADGGHAVPIWLGTVAAGTARFALPSPGRPIFRLSEPAGSGGAHYETSYRILCRTGERRGR